MNGDALVVIALAIFLTLGLISFQFAIGQARIRDELAKLVKEARKR
jgi:CBS domain containing-hemolysin-like protein